MSTRFLPIALAAACVLLASPGRVLALSAQQVFSASSHAVAALHTFDESGQQTGVHSAIQIGAQRFITTCEVLEGAHVVRLQRPSESNVDAIGVIVARDRERNLCLVDVQVDAQADPKATAEPAILARGVLPPVGSRVYAVSNALGLGVGISEGVVSGVRQFPGGNYIQFTAPISPGSEGGALLDDQGRLIGVLDYRHRGGQNVNFAPLAAWVDEVAARSEASAAQQKRFDAAAELRKTAQWAALAALSAEWLRAQAGDRDALRFAVAAAVGLKDVPAELAAWRELYRQNPDQPENGLGLGEALLARRLVDEARSHAERLVAAQPENARAHWLLARAQHTGGALAEAEASYRRAIELDTWLVAAYEGLARLAEARGDHGSAIAIWSRLSGLYSQALQPRIALARAYMLAGRNGRAYTVLQNLPPAVQDGATAWYWRGVALQRIGAPDAAVQAYRTSLDRKSEFDADAWNGIGEAMTAMDRWPEAIAALQAAVQAAPANDAWRYNLAWALAHGGRAAEALPMLEALTEKAPNTAIYWRMLGIALQRLDRPREAATATERALQLAPRDVATWDTLVTVRRSAGQAKEAREAYQQLLTLDSRTAADSYRRNMLPFEGAAP